MPSPSSTPPPPCPFVDHVSPGWCFAGGVRVGDNSLTGHDPGAVVGHDLVTNRNGSQMLWDDNLSDGFDSGWVSVQLIGEVGGGANGVTWTLVQPGGKRTVVTYSGVTYATIESVQISAAVSAKNMKITWRSITAEFYRDGELVDAVSLAHECNPVADTTGPDAPGSASEVAELFPDSGGITKVIVTGLVELESPLTTLPAPDAITGQILVFADNCAAT